jgi:hypothetical protein
VDTFLGVGELLNFQQDAVLAVEDIQMRLRGYSHHQLMLNLPLVVGRYIAGFHRLPEDGGFAFVGALDLHDQAAVVRAAPKLVQT